MGKTQSLPLIQCKICDQRKSFFSNIPNKLSQEQFLNEGAHENEVVTCVLEFLFWSTEEGRRANEVRLTEDFTCYVVCF